MADNDTKSTTLAPESGFRLSLMQLISAVLFACGSLMAALGAGYSVGVVAAQQDAHEASPGHAPTVERLRQVELTQASIASSLKSLVALERRRK